MALACEWQCSCESYTPPSNTQQPLPLELPGIVTWNASSMTSIASPEEKARGINTSSNPHMGPSSCRRH